ncbi:hypothetical protein [Bradyrhizobium sp. 195]|uniref:hypothetical protein n=1 Tax=Bradyrhizobium sp. 195 TaxID=2782662 RepID=UPI0020018A11|nr:hypothetical protein [Bradyrhizobium sp. 195]UPK30841.1 hypothetical protein IVB26_39925 [Bradyrhizobium sp. 195]
MTPRPNPISLRPALGQPKHKPLFHACFASVMAVATGRDPEELLARMYPDDRIAPLMLARASLSPGGSATSGNATELTQNAVADFVGSLIPLSAAAALVPKGYSLRSTTLA